MLDQDNNLYLINLSILINWLLDFSYENLMLDQDNNLYLINLSILINWLLDNVWISQ